MADKNIIIINFEGVIGSIAKFPFWDPNSKKSVYFRHGTLEVLKRMSQKYQLVFMGG